MLAVLLVPAMGTPAWREIALLWTPITLLFLLPAGFYCWYAFHRMAGTSFLLTDDAMVHATRKKVTHYPWEAVYLEPVGGVLKVRAGNDLVRVTAVLQDISGFVAELKRHLDAKHLSSHYDTDTLFRFFTHAVRAQDSWDRAYAWLGKSLLFVGNLCSACGAGYAYGTQGRAGLWWLGMWLLFSFFYWCSVVPGIADTVLMRRRALQADQGSLTCPARDSEYEREVLGGCFTWGSVAYILLSLGVLACMFVTDGR